MSSPIELLSSTRSAGGWHRRYRHHSETLNCDMTFAAFLPPQAENGPVPALWWLSGLTCTDENFMLKAGAHQRAAELGIALIAPDTSPRGTDLPGEHEDWDFGSGAGFYLNATQQPWSQHYQMFDYVTEELRSLVTTELPLSDQRSIAGHSMGGHGALICALKKPELYQSVSAFAPICAPSRCAWGHKAFSHYLGPDESTWSEWDSSELIRRKGTRFELLVDQGEADDFLHQGELRPDDLEAACESAKVQLTLRRQPDYDHSYFFIASFINDHLDHHAKSLFKS